MIKAIAAIAACLLIAAPAVHACGTAEVCADVVSSFSGDVLLDGFALTWDTDAGDSGLVYQLWRYTTDPDDREYVTYRAGYASCQQLGSYSATDYTTTEWVYTVEVWTVQDVRLCAVDTVPE